MKVLLGKKLLNESVDFLHFSHIFPCLFVLFSVWCHYFSFHPCWIIIFWYTGSISKGFFLFAAFSLSLFLFHRYNIFFTSPWILMIAYFFKVFFSSLHCPYVFCVPFLAYMIALVSAFQVIGFPPCLVAFPIHSYLRTRH